MSNYIDHSGSEWTKIDAYLEYQREWNMRVYVAIGVGGLPSNPQQLFITPLDHICSYPFVYRSRLIPFKRNFDHGIDDAEQLELF